MRRAYQLIVVLFYVCSSSYLTAGIMAITGREKGLWTGEDATFVLVATIKAVEAHHGDHPDETHHVTLVPHATLAGMFDVSLHPEIVARACVGVYGTSVTQPPASGSLAIAVMRPHEGALWIDSATIGFVPGGSALTVVSGWDDPRIDETLRRIQIARSSRAPATNPSTQPAP